MISATPHLLYVDEDMRTGWYHFWQRAQEICREATAELDADKQPNLVAALIQKEFKVGRSNIDLRELHHKLQETARSAASAAMAG